MARLSASIQADNEVVSIEDEVTQLFEESRADVYRYVLTLGLDPGRAQEAAQEAFLRLYQALRKADDIQNKRAWVFRVAHNFALRFRHREARLESIDPEMETGLRDQRVSPERSAIERERNLLIHRALETLSPQQKHCLYLRAEGFRYREIAEILGISDSAVGEFLRRAITRLRKATHE